MIEEDPKWRLCRLICLNRDQEIYPPDLDLFFKIFDITKETQEKFKDVGVYCDCCRIMDRYAFLFCKHYSGPAAFILACFTCENHDGKECMIMDQIVEIEARQWAARDRHMLIHKPPSEN